MEDLKACSRFEESCAGNKETLDDLVSNFMNQVKGSDWLKENTAEKWEKENPEVATQYKEVIKNALYHGCEKSSS